MKRVVLALCAVAMLSMVACKKDTNENQNNPGGGTEQVPQGEGIFSPSQKIETITIDGQLSEEWTWTNDKLVSIAKAEGGAMLDNTTFEYNGWRVSSMSTIMESMPVDVDYTYNNDKLSTVAAYSSYLQVVGILFDHNAEGKINHLSLNINSMLLDALVQMLGNGIPIFGMKGPASSKMSIDSTNFNAYLTWQGDNVSQMVLSGTVMAQLTLDEISQYMNIDSLIGGNSWMLAMLTDSTLSVTINLADTNRYTYDSQHNPFCGYLGALDITTMSANNVATMHASGVVNISVTAQTLMGPVTLPLPSYPIEERNDTYTYTYNSAGYPLTSTNSEGSVTQYTYKQ